jgi:hypothetical protein
MPLRSIFLVLLLAPLLPRITPRPTSSWAAIPIGDGCLRCFVWSNGTTFGSSGLETTGISCVFLDFHGAFDSNYS